MNDLDKIAELKRLHEAIENGDLREDIRVRRAILAEVCGLLAHDPGHQKAARVCSQILSQSGFSSGMYEQSAEQLALIVGTAITELEHPVPKTAEKPTLSGEAVKVPLTTEHTPLWFLHHCHYSVKWQLAALFVTVAGSLIGFGFYLGRQNIPTKIVDLLSPPSQSSSPADKTATVKPPASAK